MAVSITHSKTDTLTDWTQPELDAAIAGTPPPIPPGTLLVDIVLPSDWNDTHVISGLATVAETGDYSDLINKPTIPSAITVKDEGVTLTATPTEMNFTGGGITATNVGNVVTVNVPAGAVPDVLELPEQGSDPAPIADTVQLYSRDVATRSMPTVIEPVGMPYELQASFARKKIALVSAIGGGATNLTLVGEGGALGATLTGRNQASTNLFSSIRRAGAVSSAGAGTSNSIRGNALRYWLGNAAGLGGFLFHKRLGPSSAATVADSRCFFGLYGTTAVIGNVDPSSLTDIIGFGSDHGEANLSVMHNDVAGTATKVPLGANFPAQTLSVDMYDMFLFAQPNATEVGWNIVNLDTGNVASGTITTDLPSNTTFLAYQLWVNNGATALAAAFDFSHAYFETDY
jgi:hypothetical protein